MARRSTGLVVAAALGAGCVSPIDVDIAVVNPCNQQAIQEVDFLRFEPRGTNVDSNGLTVVQRVADNVTPAIPIPLTNDFQLVVTGHRESFDNPPQAIGVSPRFDLSGAEQAVSIGVPFGLVDRFYRTTDVQDPITCTNMAVARYGATVTNLPGLDRALVIGGASLKDGAIEFRRAIEMYDPRSGRFDVVGELSAGGARAFHTATLLADGRIFVAGGEALVGQRFESLRSALIVDPRDPTFVTVSEVIDMKIARAGHNAVRLADGLVVLVGGRQLNPQAQTPQEHQFVREIGVFDPQRGEFLTAENGGVSGDLSMAAGRYGHSSLLLDTGRDILSYGGYNETGPVRTFEVIRVAADVIQVSTASVSGAGSSVGPIFHAAAAMDDGRILLAGGYDTVARAEPGANLPSGATQNVEMWTYRPTRGQLIRSCNASMVDGRGRFTATPLGSRVLFTGGRRANDGRPSTTAEIATVTDSASCFATTPSLVELDTPRAQHTATVLSSGDVLVVGGRLQDPGDPLGTSSATAEVFTPQRTP